MSSYAMFHDIRHTPLIEWREDGSVYVKSQEDDPHHFSELSEGEQKLVLEWMLWNIDASERVYHDATSYGMKHMVQSRLDIYMSNKQFKEAMLMLGYIPADISALNWKFYIKPSSPIFKTLKDGKPGYPVFGLEMLKERTME